MKKNYFVLAGILFALSASVSGQMVQQFNPVQDPVSWGDPNAVIPGSIYVSRYGYWRNQPVKMAYWTGLPHYQVPPVFHLADASGRIVYTGHPVWMRNPENVMAPVGAFYPGARVYALNFSGFDQAGTYYIEMPGHRISPDFNIRGYMPGSVAPLPGLMTFERDAGMLPPGYIPVRAY
ncbi:MAG: hypothetical protein IJW23_07115 [Lentisphaeria bacterium]|nr:hypothetical protein [Lentisphaeria bacterium]